MRHSYVHVALTVLCSSLVCHSRRCLPPSRALLQLRGVQLLQVQQPCTQLELLLVLLPLRKVQRLGPQWPAPHSPLVQGPVAAPLPWAMQWGWGVLWR